MLITPLSTKNPNQSTHLKNQIAIEAEASLVEVAEVEAALVAQVRVANQAGAADQARAVALANLVEVVALARAAALVGQAEAANLVDQVERAAQAERATPEVQVVHLRVVAQNQEVNLLVLEANHLNLEAVHQEVAPLNLEAALLNLEAAPLNLEAVHQVQEAVHQAQKAIHQGKVAAPANLSKCTQFQTQFMKYIQSQNHCTQTQFMKRLIL